MASVGPFTLTGEVTDDHVDMVRSLLAAPIPWHAFIPTTVSIRTGNWPVTSFAGTTIHMPPTFRDWRSVLAHELGHVFDLRHLPDADHAAIHDAMHEGDGGHLVTDRDDVGGEFHAWGLRGDVAHSVAPSEAFANWFRWRAGLVTSTSYGLHTWHTAEQQQAIEGIVMAAADNVQVFSDVPPDHTHAAGIHWAAGQGLVGGYPDGTFRPDEPVSRAQFCTVLARLPTEGSSA